MKLEIVSHCWRYSRLLNYQLSSLVLSPPMKTSTLVTVFLAKEDEETLRVVEFFAHIANEKGITIRNWVLPKEQLMRREIGRNMAALATVADWVWFTDCDYCFGSGAIDGIEPAVTEFNGPLVYPSTVFMNKNHSLGDAAIESISDYPCVKPLDPNDFSPTRYRRAIGGVQIARGDTVRDRGYLKNSRIQTWTASTWQRCVGDTWFRRDLASPGQQIDLPNVFRIRHTYCGRQHHDLVL